MQIKALLCLATAASALQLPFYAPDAGDRKLSGASRIGKSDGGVHATTNWEFTDCGNPSDVITIKSLDVKPDPPRPGEKLTIYASGTVHELVDEGAYADIVVKLGLIKLLSRRFDVCEELAKANATLQCPIQPGEYTIEQSVDLPREIPRAKFLVQARAFTQEPERDMACADIRIDFLHRD